jgi:hypothetical protein
MSATLAVVRGKVSELLKEGYEVALFGESLGGATIVHGV